MQVTTQTYTLLLDKAQEQDILRAGTIGNVRIIDNAYSVVEQPAKPVRPLVLLVAIFIGLLVSALVILLRHVFYRGVESPDAVEELGIPVYAALPYSGKQEHLYRQRKMQDGCTRLLSIIDPADLAVESLRSLRTSLKFTMLDARNKVLVITSPTPSSGKSFVSSNLAAVIAQAGQRVLLIDADMRRGYLHHLFSLPSRSGLSDALVAGLKLSEVVNHTSQANLDFVTSGLSAPWEMSKTQITLMGMPSWTSVRASSSVSPAMSSRPVRSPSMLWVVEPSSTRRRGRPSCRPRSRARYRGSYPVHVLVPTVSGAS